MEQHPQASLEELKQQLLRMGGLAEGAVHQAISSVLEGDGERAKHVLIQETTINEMQISIDQDVLRIVSEHRLSVDDLRFIFASTRINADLERIADQAVNIAESSLRILRYPRVKPYVDLPRMGDLAEEMVRDSLNSLVNEDNDLAKSVLERDNLVDNLRDQIFRELLTYMMGNATMVYPAFDLILVAKNLERIGDLATNIAEDVIYTLAGQDVRHHALDQR